MNAATAKRAPRKIVKERSKLLTRRQMLVALPKDTRKIIEGGEDVATKNFLLDVLRLGEAGILR